MFTGIIEDIGEVLKIRPRLDVYELEIKSRFAGELSIGDSVSVNGACLTVVEKTESTFTVELSAETVARTSFLDLKIGDYVNLERALRASSRLDGHIVTGHVDGVGTVTSIKSTGRAAEIFIRLPEDLIPFVATKGSIAIDGISLTVASREGSIIRISVIPHTFKNTTLSLKKPGSRVNVEVDIIARYVANFLDTEKSEKTLKDFLEGR